MFLCKNFCVFVFVLVFVYVFVLVFVFVIVQEGEEGVKSARGDLSSLLAASSHC